jgi:regulator of protease activity HflC (stomatin/prohibitin superfamily)
LAASLLAIGVGLLWHTPVIVAVAAVILAALTLTMAAGAVIDAARRAVAFRAGQAGITLGAVPGKLSGRGPAVFIAWADIDRIVLYPARKITGWRLDRERLAAVTAAVAPGIPIIDASTRSQPGVEGPGHP